MTATGALPPLYFRVKENGALVFRVETQNRERRLELVPIASVNVRNGEIRPQGGGELAEGDRAAMENWIAERNAELARREMSGLGELIEGLNLAAQWAQARATPEELDAVTDRLLLAMHDLRSVLARKRAERFIGG
ncbi:hypothetical protein [uncultured Jannaschia sp.]|uniref:hypothetical protein n=1 Tax=uncultured Jannaschia sp. TaxID=293347 RepID=UPI0026104ED6|nr:hypothetical protein [uncultured Jannaschia sp.]